MKNRTELISGVAEQMFVYSYFLVVVANTQAASESM